MRTNIIIRIVIVMSVVLLGAIQLFATTDYSKMSTQELSQIRGTMRNATQEERDVFRKEWQQRIQNMTQEERQQFLGRPAEAAMDGTGSTQEMGQRRGRGSGRGMGRKTR